MNKELWEKLHDKGIQVDIIGHSNPDAPNGFKPESIQVVLTDHRADLLYEFWDKIRDDIVEALLKEKVD